MHQDYYQYIYQVHQRQIEIGRTNQILSKTNGYNPPLRKRFLLSASDILLAFGQRIRPAEFQVDVQAIPSQDGGLEIKVEGC